MNALSFIIFAQQPLLLTSLQGDPNSSVSFSYIPGSSLRGALIQRYIQRFGDLDLEDATVQRLFFNQQTRYLHGYPLLCLDPDNAEFVRGLPLPRCWLQERYTEPEDDQLAGFDIGISPAASSTTKGISADYCWIEINGRPTASNVQRQVNIHNQRDRPAGRGTEDAGAVFRYEAIAPGQAFQAVILCDDASDRQLLEQLLDPPQAWLGGSRSAGYGQVTIHAITWHTDWSEVGTTPAQRLVAPGDQLRVSLLSDIVVRDQRGQAAADFPLEELWRRLGLSTPSPATQIFRSVLHHGGFNRTWGLPIPQMRALAAGSVLIFDLAGQQIDAAKAATLEWQGLGERRSEGFGRVALNWQLASSPFWLRVPKPWTQRWMPKGQHASLNNDEQQLAQDMAERLLRRKLEQELTDLIDRNQISGALAGSQLSRLRIVARRTMGDDIKQKMERLQKLIATWPQDTTAQFKKARVGRSGLRFYQWLEERIANYNLDWNEIEPITLAGQSVSVSDKLAREYTLKLIMAVARQKVKEANP